MKPPAPGKDLKRNFPRSGTRFEGIEKEIGREVGIKDSLDEIEREILAGAGEDYCASRGEYLAARVMAAVLGVPFVDAKDIVLFNADGSLDEATYPLAASVLKKYPRAVIPGFYGRGADGKIKTFSRGGSDISGAVIARAVQSLPVRKLDGRQRLFRLRSQDRRLPEMYPRAFLSGTSGTLVYGR